MLQQSYLLEELVFGYLTHSGFSDTARLVARDSLGGTREVGRSAGSTFVA